MLTYDLKKVPGIPLYEALYRHIRGDILSGKLASGEQLPSKRALSAHLEISKITVEAAYAQLLSEGFITSREKVGYFVESVQPHREQPLPPEETAPAQEAGVDLTGGGGGKFPFSVWSRLQREVMLDYAQELLRPLPNQGLPSLRRAIARHLAEFRDMTVAPENILVGAGTDFLYNLLIQLLGRHRLYGVEDPGYGKIHKIYAAGGARCVPIPMDDSGVIPSSLGEAQVLHISPSHHFPTGLVMPMQRRLELLGWVAQGDNWIIEDDYDSEFRFDQRPKPALHTLDGTGRVIYMNTFSKSLAPSIRISYMVLPPALMQVFRERLGFYSCTVPSFEQYTLERFLSRGHFEKHINRMRKYYKSRRNRLLELLSGRPGLTIMEQDAGLHFLLKVDTELDDATLVARCRERGLLLHSLSRYYHGPVPQDAQHTLIVNYDHLSDQDLLTLEQVLKGWNLP